MSEVQNDSSPSDYPAAGLGIASFFIGLLLILVLSIGIAWACLSEDVGILAVFMIYIIPIFLIRSVLAPIGIVLAISAFFQRKRSHVATYLGLVANVLIVILLFVPEVYAKVVAHNQREAARAAEARAREMERVLETKRQAQAVEAKQRADQEAAETNRQADAAEARRRAEEEAKRQADAAEAKRRAEEEAKVRAQREAERKRSITELRMALKETDPKARALAAEILGERKGAASIAVPDLINALQDPNEDVRHQAAVALGRIGTKAALPNLVQAIGDPEVRVSQAAQQAIISLGALTDDDLPILSKFVKDKNIGVRHYTIKAIAKVGKPAVPLLLGLLKDPEISESVIEALLSIDKLSMGKAEIPALVDALATKDRAVRVFVLAAILKVGPEAKTAVPAILKILKEESDSTLRDMCMDGLEKIGAEAKDAAPYLTEALKDRASALRAAEVLASIGGFRASSAIGTLTENLTHNDEKLRARAAAGLLKIDPEQLPATSVRALTLAALKDTDERVRSVAVEALVKIGKGAVPGLVNVLQTDINSSLRLRACLALGEIGPAAKDALPVVNAVASDDRSSDVRKAAKATALRIQSK